MRTGGMDVQAGEEARDDGMPVQARALLHACRSTACSDSNRACMQRLLAVGRAPGRGAFCVVGLVGLKGQQLRFAASAALATCYAMQSLPSALALRWHINMPAAMPWRGQAPHILLRFVQPTSQPTCTPWLR